MFFSFVYKRLWLFVKLLHSYLAFQVVVDLLYFSQKYIYRLFGFFIYASISLF